MFCSRPVPLKTAGLLLGYFSVIGSFLGVYLCWGLFTSSRWTHWWWLRRFPLVCNALNKCNKLLLLFYCYGIKQRIKPEIKQFLNREN